MLEQKSLRELFSLPCPKFSIVEVMKMLKTFLKTSPSNIELNFPDPFQAMMIIALIEGNMPKKIICSIYHQKRKV